MLTPLSSLCFSLQLADRISIIAKGGQFFIASRLHRTTRLTSGFSIQKGIVKFTIPLVLLDPYSRRKASMGLRRAAWTAGTAPKKRPTRAENTTVAATMYQLMKMGTPETRDTM